MRLVYSPQNLDIDCSIEIEGEALTVTVQGVSDVFDFSGMPDGKSESISTILPISPVTSAERVGGELTVNLVHWYGSSATAEEKTVREVIV